MLETIRAYATERFAPTTDEEAVHERHYRHYLALAQRHGAERALWARAARNISPNSTPTSTTSTRPSRGRLRGDAERALAMVAALSCYWPMRDRYADAVDWVDQALNLPGADAHPALRVRALCIKGRCLWALGRGPSNPRSWPRRRPPPERSAIPLILSQAL